MNRSLYPKNWNAIALQVKSEANWHCQECDRPCRMPGESFDELLDRIGFSSFQLEFIEFYGGFGHRLKPGQFILTVAHLDQNPANNDPKNLRALCSVCHLRYDAIPHSRSRRHNRRAKLEAEGQLYLLLDD